MSSDELYHFGVKGMKWGRRKGPQVGDRIKAPDGQMATVMTPARKLSRKEVRVLNKTGKEQWAKNKANKLLEAAQNDALIKLSTPYGAPMVVSGKQFVDYLGSSGAFNVHVSDVWANKTASGAYELAKPTATYKKIKR